MTVLELIRNGEPFKLYIDDNLYRRLNNEVIPTVQKKDFDCVFCVDGGEGVGKSVLAQQIAFVLDPNFSIDNICFTPNDFINAIKEAKKQSCIVFDEAFTGLSSRGSMSEINKAMVSLMMEMRQKNLFVIIVMPTLFMLDRYIILHRARGLFNVYLNNGRRGYWKYYNRNSLKRLYLTGKKMYEYQYVKPNFFGRFLDKYTVNEIEYRAKKALALDIKAMDEPTDKYKVQRDILIRIMYKELKLTQTGISDYCKQYGFKIEQNTISDIVGKLNQNNTFMMP